MRKVAMSVVTVFMCLFMLTGCFKETLEDKISQRDISTMEQQLMFYPQVKETFKAIKMEVKGNNVTCKYYFRNSMSESQISSFKLNVRTSSLQAEIIDAKDSIQKDYGIRPEKLTYEYYTNTDELIVAVEG